MADMILFVDDSPVIKKIVKKSVENMGYEFLEANNGKEALYVLARDGDYIRLVLSDWNMPVMNGFELLKSIKGNKSYHSIPVVMITTEAEKSNINMAMQAGAADYMLKPFNPQDLVVKIEKILGK